jgi:iron complex outermembrane receptor protein
MSDHNAALTQYAVTNAGIFYHFKSKIDVTLGVQINNMSNELYQSTPDYPMPGRNYQMQLTFKL